MNAPAAKARIALVAFSSLGDGLIYLMMAENLRLNGFAVTYFGNIGYQLRAWLPQFEIRPYPAAEEMDAALAGFDLVIMSPPQFLRDRMDPATTDAMRRKWLLICQKTPDDWRFDLTETKRATLPPDTFAALHGLLDCGGSIRDRDYTTESVVDITLEYMQKRMGLAQLTRTVALTPPAGLQLRRHTKRIVVSPDSAWPQKKDWPPRAFLKLCRSYDLRLFTFVIGNGANQPLMEALALDSQGFAMNLSDADDMVGRLIQAKAVLEQHGRG